MSNNTAVCGIIKYFSPSNSISTASFLKKIAKSPSFACRGMYFTCSEDTFQGSSSSCEDVA